MTSTGLSGLLGTIRFFLSECARNTDRNARCQSMYNITHKGIPFSIGWSGWRPDVSRRDVIEAPGTDDFVGDVPGAQFLIFKTKHVTYVIPYDPKTILLDIAVKATFSEISRQAQRLYQDITQDSSIESLYEPDDLILQILIVFQLMTDVYDRSR